MSEKFKHKSLKLKNDKPLIYTAMSKYLFYYRMQISKFVFNKGGVPLNPFMISDYFMADTVDRDSVRESNNVLVKRSDEVWVFGDVSDGVLAEIKIAKNAGKPIRYFRIEKSKDILPVNIDKVKMEKNVENFRKELT